MNLLSAALSLLISSVTSGDIGELWDAYNAAKEADLPETELSILSEIKEKAKKEGLLWDFYHAGKLYVSTASDKNWKKWDDLDMSFHKEMAGLKESVMWIYDRHPGHRFVSSCKWQLQNEFHREFWENDRRINRYSFKDALLESFWDDWDYACFVTLDDYPAFRHVFTGRYPLDALAEFTQTEPENHRAFGDKYHGKAVSLLAEEIELDHLFFQKKKDSRYYLDLKERCEEFQRKVDGYDIGIERTIARSIKGPQKILEALEEKDNSCHVSCGEIYVFLRNLSSTDVFIRKDGKQIFSTHIENPACSFYAPDSIKVDTPELDDGIYEVGCTNDDLTSICRYEKASLSLAVRTNLEGLGIYVTDFMTGEPVKEAVIEILEVGDSSEEKSGGRKVAESAVVKLNEGFTNVPEEIMKVIGTVKYPRIAVRSGSRRSKIMTCFYDSHFFDNPEKYSERCRILSDRKAYYPEETFHFKLICTKGVSSFRPLVSANLTVTLQDPEFNVIDSLSLKTDEYGCADGKMILKRSMRGGRYVIKVTHDEDVIGRTEVLVDEFVLPGFELVFEDIREPVCPPVDELHFRGSARAFSGHKLTDATIEYSVTKNYTKISEGKLILSSDGYFDIPVPVGEKLYGYNCFCATIKITDKGGETHEFEKTISVQEKRPDEKKVTEHFFEKIADDKQIGARIVSAPQKKTWAVLELYGEGGILLEKQAICFTGETKVVYPFKPSYPRFLELNVLYFQNGTEYFTQISAIHDRHEFDLKLEFGRFIDKTRPGTSYKFTIRTKPGVQCAVSVFDKSTEVMAQNLWKKILPVTPYNRLVNISHLSGSRSEWFCCTKSKAKYVANRLASLFMDEEETLPFLYTCHDANDESDGIRGVPRDGQTGGNYGEVYVRKNFANTIAWEPSLKSDAKGNVTLDFTTSDKLSTYYVQVFASDKKMRNAVMRREMKVTVPVMISFVEPRMLYAGDSLTVRAVLYNNLEKDVSGKLVFDDRDAFPLTVRANGSESVQYAVMPENPGSRTIKIVFIPDDKDSASDGIKVSFPVLNASQTITEVHSSLLMAGEDSESLIAGLRSKFVNVPESAASLRKISIMDMIQEAVPAEINPKGQDVISLAMAAKARAILGMDRNDLIARINECRTDKGGWSWFKGLSVSSVVTAVVLEMLKGELGDAGTAVKYLDSAFVTDSHPWQSLSLEQYLYVRSLYPEYDFSEKLTKETVEKIQEYLCPEKEHGHNGLILMKARRILTLENLISSENGKKLADKFLSGTFSESRIRDLIHADRTSLCQYAVPHKSGGTYFPNAVMPWRGLLESEIYAHVILCRLFEGTETADGIRLWIMVQKETQEWDSDPAFINALNLVIKGTEKLKRTEVMVLSGKIEKPFTEIKASGNGFSLTSSTYPEAAVGQKISHKCVVNSEENRSFVRVTVPFPAGLQPVHQFSGYCRYNCYRSVLKDRIEYWFDTLQEHKVTLTDEFFVVRGGAFQCPPASAECLYSSHYRANTGSMPITTIK